MVKVNRLPNQKKENNHYLRDKPMNIKPFISIVKTVYR